MPDHSISSPRSLTVLRLLSGASPSLIAGVGLAGLAGAALLILIRHLGLYADDWSFLYGTYQYGWGFQDLFLPSSRPLHALPWNLSYTLFGQALLPRYLLQFTVIWSNALLLFWLLNRLWPDLAKVNFLSAALFLVYPTVTTYSWLSAGPMILAVNLFLFSLCIFLKRQQVERTSQRLEITSASLYFLSLLFYELHLGLVLAVPLLAYLALPAARPYAARVRHALYASLPYFIALGVYVTYRFGIKSLLGLSGKGTNEGMNLDLSKALFKLWNMRSNLGSVWPFVLRREIEAFQDDYLVLVVFSFGVLLAAACAGYLWFKARKLPETGMSRTGAYRPPHFWIAWVVVGVFLLVLGYLPIFPSVYGPAWPNDLSSRVGYAAAIGASLSVTGSLFLVFTVLGRLIRVHSLSLLALVASSLLIGLSVAHSYTIQGHYAEAWRLERRVYAELLRVAPRLANGTLVVLLDAPDQVGTVKVIEYPYNALRLLYNNPTLDALSLSSVHPAATEARFTKAGLLPHLWSQSIVPYHHMVLVAYDQEGCSMVIDRFPAANSQSKAVPHLEHLRTNEGRLLPAAPLPPTALRLLDLPVGAKYSYGSRHCD